jgi:hypothetical protein
MMSTVPRSNIFLLSNNHVIARFNGEISSSPRIDYVGAGVDDDLLHPGASNPQLPCAKLVQWSILYGYQGSPPRVNTMDAAIAKPLVPINPNRQGAGIPEALGDAELLDEVYMTGAQSGHTQGTVLEINGRADCPQYGPRGRIVFEPCIQTTLMSTNGDSGSVIVKKDPNLRFSKLAAVGLIFASHDDVTHPPNLPMSYACHLRTVLDAFKVDLLLGVEGYPHINWD